MKNAILLFFENLFKSATIIFYFSLNMGQVMWRMLKYV